MNSTKIFAASLQTRARTPLAGDEVEAVCQFEEGYAAYLEPFFDKLNQESGQLLVFLNGATFGGEDLKWVSALIWHVRASLKSQPENWDVSLGWQLEPPDSAREILAPVNKFAMNALLDRVDAAIEDAKTRQIFLRFNFWGA